MYAYLYIYVFIQVQLSTVVLLLRLDTYRESFGTLENIPMLSMRCSSVITKRNSFTLIHAGQVLQMTRVL